MSSEPIVTDNAPPVEPRSTPRGEPQIPRGWLRVGLPLGILVLTALFTFLQFPFERLAPWVSSQLGRALGAEVRLAGLDVGLGLTGPMLHLRDLEAIWPGGETLELGRVRVAPAASLSWAFGRPALSITAAGPSGDIDGRATLGDEPAFDGNLVQIDLGLIPFDLLAPGLALAGRADLSADVEVVESELSGDATFSANAGSIGYPSLPIDIPYQNLLGVLRFGDDALVQVLSLDLQGPLLSAQVEGKVGRALRLAQAPIDLEVLLEVEDPNVRPALQASGLRIGADGRLDIRLTGSVSQPRVR